MDTPLSELSGSALRKLMIEELRQFILLLDTGTPEELQRQKDYLTEIFARLSYKEQEELQNLMSMVAEISAPSYLHKTA